MTECHVIAEEHLPDGAGDGRTRHVQRLQLLQRDVGRGDATGLRLGHRPRVPDQPGLRTRPGGWAWVWAWVGGRGGYVVERDTVGLRLGHLPRVPDQLRLRTRPGGWAWVWACVGVAGCGWEWLGGRDVVGGTRHACDSCPRLRTRPDGWGVGGKAGWARRGWAVDMGLWDGHGRSLSGQYTVHWCAEQG